MSKFFQNLSNFRLIDDFYTKKYYIYYIGYIPLHLFRSNSLQNAQKKRKKIHLSEACLLVLFVEANVVLDK